MISLCCDDSNIKFLFVLGLLPLLSFTELNLYNIVLLKVNKNNLVSLECYTFLFSMLSYT